MSKRDQTDQFERRAGTPASPEEALRRAHEDLKATWDALPDLVFEVDREGRIHNYHASHPELLYVPPETFLGKPFTAILPATAAMIIMGAITEAAANGRHTGAVYALDLPQGRRWFELSIAAKNDPHAPTARFVMLVRDITAHRQAEEAAVATAENYRAIFDSVHDSIFIHDAETGAVLDVNAGAIAQSGYSREELCRADLQLFTTAGTPYTLESALQRLREASTGKVHTFEWKMRTKSGTEVWLEVTLKSVTLAGKHRVLAVSRDITERKRSEMALRFTQFGIDRADIPIFWVDSGYRFTYVNDAACRSVGYSRAELLAMRVPDINPEFPTARLDELWQKLKRLGSVSLEGRHRTKTGRIFPTDLRLNLVVFEGNEYVCGFAPDITERKRIEETVREQLAQIEAVYQTAPVGLCLLDPNFRYLRINAQLAELNGVPAQDHIGRTVREVVPQLADQTEELCRQVMTTRQPVLNIELTGQTSAQPGVIRSWIANWWPITQADGSLSGVSVVVEEITARKQAEEALRNSAAEVRARLADIESIYNSSVVGLCVLDRDFRYRRINEKLAAMNGPSVAAHLGRTMREVVPRIADIVEPQLRHTLETGEPILNWEITGETPDQPGVQRTWLTSWVPVKDAAGFVTAVHAVGVEITARKHAEIALQASEAKYRRLHESMMDAFVSIDMQGRITDYNQSYQEMLGYSDTELRQLTYIDLTPEKWHPIEAQILAEQVLPHGYSAVYEKEYRRKGGAIFPVELRTFLIRDATNQPAGMWAIVRDITARKQVEAAHRASEERYRQFADSIPVPAWEATPTGEGLYCNREWRNYTGMTPQEFQGWGWTQTIHLDDISPTQAIIAECVQRGVFYQAEYRLRRHDGVYRWHLSRGYPARDATGTITRWFGTSTDIHDQKLAREELERQVQDRTAALRESEERYHGLLELAPIGISVVVDGRFCYVNPALASTLGAREPAELLGKSAVELTHPNDRDWVTERIQQVQDQRQPVPPRERKIVRLDGEVRNVFLTSVPITYQGQPGFLSVLRDVTEIRRLEREIAEISNQERARIGHDLHDSVCQQLVGIAFTCAALQNDLTQHNPSLAPRAAKIARLAQQTLAETRTLAQGLSPIELGDRDLSVAFHQLAANTEQVFAVKCTAVVSGVVRLADSEQALHLYRIAQEAINNAIRHGKAKHIRMALHVADGRLNLTVQDNGVGLSQAAAAGKTTGMGLSIMRYRADAIGATLTVQPSGSSGGTVVTCSLPLPTAAASTQQTRGKKPAKSPRPDGLAKRRRKSSS